MEHNIVYRGYQICGVVNVIRYPGIFHFQGGTTQNDDSLQALSERSNNDSTDCTTTDL